ncbi:MAG: YdjY domain-containing protein [Verrucomicrobiota bacterium]
MKTRLLPFCIPALLLSSLAAQDEAKPAAAGADADAKPKKPAVKKISDTEFELGEIKFDGKKREVRIPAQVNATGDRDIIEYVLVHESGKTHESLLKTAISPLDLQVVFKLLSFKSGKGSLFDNFYPPGQLPDPEPRGEAIDVLVTWEGGEEYLATTLVRDLDADSHMEKMPWYHNGSEIVDGVFEAEREGSVIALYLDPYAMLNLSHPRAADDENWFPISKNIPAYETPVTVILRPAAAEKED